MALPINIEQLLDARTYFLVNFPIHSAFSDEPLLKSQNEANNEGVNGARLTKRQLNITIVQ